MGDFPPSPPLTDPRRATTTRHAGKGDSRSWSPSRSPVPVNLPPSPPLTNPRHAVTIASTVSDASLFEGGDYFCSTNNAAPIFHGQRIGAAAIPWQSSSGEPESCDSNLSAGSSSESSYPESSSDENTDIYDSDQPDGEPADTESEAGELSVEKPCENERTKLVYPSYLTSTSLS
jgi:hypothetical protein